MQIGDKVKLLKDRITLGGNYFKKGEIMVIRDIYNNTSFFLMNSLGKEMITTSEYFEFIKDRCEAENNIKKSVDKLKEVLKRLNIIKEDKMNKIEIELNGEKVLLDVDRARELGLIEDARKDLIKKKRKYYAVEPNGNVTEYEHNHGFDGGCYEDGNYFYSERVAQSKIDQLGGLTGRIQAYILEENARTGWVADWDDEKQKKCIICREGKRYYYTSKYTCNYIGVIYTSEEIAEELANKLNDGWR